MNDLSKHRRWLTLPEAAESLSREFENGVGEADILRFALDDHIRLSVHLPVPVVATRIRRRTDDERRERTSIEGLCDLVLEGAGRAEIESRYHLERDLPYVPVPFGVGALVKKNGKTYKLPPALRTVSSSVHSALPRESVLVVRREALDEFIHLHKSSKPSQQAGTSSQEMHPRERNTLLLIIAALLKEAKLENLSSHKAAESIAATIRNMDIGETRSSDAIREKFVLSREYLRTQPKKPKATS